MRKMHQKILRVQPSCCHDPTGDGLNKKLLSVTVSNNMFKHTVGWEAEGLFVGNFILDGRK